MTETTSPETTTTTTNQPTDQPPVQPPAQDTTQEGGEDNFTLDENEAPAVWEKENTNDAGGDDDLSDEEIDLLDPKQAKEYMSKLAEKKARKLITPYEERAYQQRVDGEVQNYLDKYPEYKPYEKRIRNFVNHENRKGLIKQGLPVSTVIIEAVAPFLQRIGAQKAKAAQAQAEATRNAGTNSRPTSGGAPDYSSMSSEDISRLAEMVKTGRYKG